MSTHPTPLGSAVKTATVLCTATALTLGFTGAAWAVAPVEVGYDLISFLNPANFVEPESDDIGFDAQLGDVVDYEDVFAGVDAQVTVVAITNLSNEVDKIDEGQNQMEPGDGDSALWIEIDPPGSSGSPATGGPGSATFQIDFYEEGGDFTTPITLNEVAITVKDIDSLQSITFEDVSSYELSSVPETVLTATVDGEELTIAETEELSSDAVDEEHWVVVRFDSLNSITVTVGAIEGGDAEFGLLFRDTDWSAEPTAVDVDEPAGGGQNGLAATGADDVTVLGALGLALAAAGVTMASKTLRRRL